MKDIVDNLASYLSSLSADRVNLRPEVGKVLPLILRERFRLLHVQLFGRDWILAIEAEGWNVGGPTEYRELADRLAHALGKPVVLVLASLSSANRNRLVQMNVPFIVPGCQVFLPVSLINLREVYPRQPHRQGKRLSPIAQTMVIFQILKGELDTLSSKQVASTLGYSPMGVSKARSELEANRLCEVKRNGKEQRLVFPASAKELWGKSQRLLTSPVLKRHWVQWEARPHEAKLAGVSALSQHSGIVDDRVPNLAMRREDFRRLLEKQRLHGCPDRVEADARIETWKYAPALLSDGNAVDPLSLYLSLKDSPDERVQSELADMMENVPWR